MSGSWSWCHNGTNLAVAIGNNVPAIHEKGQGKMRTEIDDHISTLRELRPAPGPVIHALIAALEEIRVLRNEVNELNRKAITAKYGVKPCLCSCGKPPVE